MEYFSLSKPEVAELTIKKSRFIALVAPAENEKMAAEVINETRIKWPGATHYCYAFVIRSEQRIERYSDDGEPSGTAGIPILEVIKKNQLENVVAIVVRYFGGKLLGASGLIRAYTDAAVNALNQAKKKHYLLCKKVQCECAYNYLGIINNKCLSEQDLRVEHIEYGSSVTITVYIPVTKVDMFINEINQITNGSAVVNLLDDEYIPF